MSEDRRVETESIDLQVSKGVVIFMRTSMPEPDWPFDQPRNAASITLRSIVFAGAPILHVTHDEDDHGWQFLGMEDAQENDACVVALQEIVAKDPSVLELADLPPGWHAWRSSNASPWQRAPNSHENYDDG